MDIENIRAVTTAAVKLAKEGKKEEAATLLKRAHRAIPRQDPKSREMRCVCGDAEWLGQVAHALELPEVAAHIGGNTYCPEFSRERPAPLRDMVPGNWLKESILKTEDDPEPPKTESSEEERVKVSDLMRGRR